MKPILIDGKTFSIVEPIEPCPVAWESMVVCGDRQRFCGECNQVVHDLAGRSPIEIKRLFEAHGGELCGSFALDDAGYAILGKEARRPVVRYLKHWAAAATLFLICQTPHATLPTLKAPTELPFATADRAAGTELGTQPIIPNNTLITGLIKDQHHNDLRTDFHVVVFKNGTKIAEGTAINGLFMFDLRHLAAPEDIVTVTVKAKEILHLRRPAEKYAEVSLTTMLATAQNLHIEIQSSGIPPRRRGLRTVYIDEI